MSRKTKKAVKRYTLQTYWSGPPLSLLEKLCLESWTRFGARVDLFTHDSVTTMREQIPVAAKPYVTVINADVIVDRSKKFDYAGGHKSKRSDAFKALPFSDLFRYELLRKRGGVWMDFDIVLIRPIPARLFKAPYFFVSERTMQAGAYKSKETSKPTNACIYARDPESDWANHICEASEGAVVDSAWTFMKIFQASLTPELHRYIQPPEFIMPVNWWDLDGLFTPAEKLDKGGCLKAKYGVQQTCQSILKNPKSVGIHLFRGLLRKRDLPYEDETQIPASSLLGRIIDHVRRGDMLSS